MEIHGTISSLLNLLELTVIAWPWTILLMFWWLSFFLSSLQKKSTWLHSYNICIIITPTEIGLPISSLPSGATRVWEASENPWSTRQGRLGITESPKDLGVKAYTPAESHTASGDNYINNRGNHACMTVIYTGVVSELEHWPGVQASWVSIPACTMTDKKCYILLLILATIVRIGTRKRSWIVTDSPFFGCWLTFLCNIR